MNKIISSVTLFCVSVAIVGCGGGNEVLHAGSSVEAELKVGALSGATAAGLWGGMTSSSSALHYTVAILPDGQSWSVYDRNGTPYGLVHASNGWNGSQLVATGDDYLIVAGTKSTSVLQASYLSKASIKSQIQASAADSLNLIYDTAFDTPADVSKLVGTFNLNTLSPRGYSSGAVTTDATGAFTGWVATCMFTGRSIPRSDGTGIFNTTVTFAASGCSYNSQTLTGVSILNTQNSNQTLTIAGLLPDRSDGFAAIGVREPTIQSR